MAHCAPGGWLAVRRREAHGPRVEGSSQAGSITPQRVCGGWDGVVYSSSDRL